MFVPLSFARRYFRSRKLKILLVFFSLIRTFAGIYENHQTSTLRSLPRPCPGFRCCLQQQRGGDAPPAQRAAGPQSG